MKTKPRQNQIPDLETDHLLSQPSKFKYVPLVVCLLLILNLFATCSNSRTSQMAAKNQPYIYIERPDGTTIRAEPVDPLYRSDPVIAKFAEDWLKLAYSWKTSPEKGKPSIRERGVEFPYQFYAASLAIEPGYREAYMALTANKYQKQFPFTNYTTGQFQSYVRVYDGSKVQQVDKGEWDVTIVATRTHAAGSSILAHEVFNHVIRVRTIKPSAPDKKLWGDQDTQLGKLLNDLQTDGLQIVQVNEF